MPVSKKTAEEDKKNNSQLRLEEKKRCCTCKHVKPFTDYKVSKGRRGDGLSSECKKCASVRYSKWCKANPNYYKKYNKKRETNKRADKDSRFMVMTKLSASRYTASKRGHKPCTATLDELQPLYTTVCQICGTDCGNSICLDHCHNTGKFRGFICNKCNTILGCAWDSVDLLEKVIAYLKNG